MLRPPPKAESTAAKNQVYNRPREISLQNGKIAPMSQLPLGFRAAGLPRHDRPRPSRHGLAIFYSDYPAAAAACFTTNQVKCVHIPIDQEHLKRGKVRAVMINSGCANCCTGQRGVREARKTLAWASDAL